MRSVCLLRLSSSAILKAYPTAQLLVTCDRRSQPSPPTYASENIIYPRVAAQGHELPVSIRSNHLVISESGLTEIQGPRISRPFGPYTVDKSLIKHSDCLAVPMRLVCDLELLAGGAFAVATGSPKLLSKLRGEVPLIIGDNRSPTEESCAVKICPRIYLQKQFKPTAEGV